MGASAMYLTTSEYIAKFGEAETVRLTDEDRLGSVDTAKLEEALSDAIDVVDGYISKRYAVPLTEPTRLIKGIVGSLAREALYRTTVPAAVKEEADRARAQLKDIARGLLQLPAETGVVEQAVGAQASATSGDGLDPVFTSDNLSGFAIGSGYSAARWRQ